MGCKSCSPVQDHPPGFAGSWDVWRWNEAKASPALPQCLCRAGAPAHDCIPVSGMDEAIRAWRRS